MEGVESFEGGLSCIVFAQVRDQFPNSQESIGHCTNFNQIITQRQSSIQSNLYQTVKLCLMSNYNKMTNLHFPLLWLLIVCSTASIPVQAIQTSLTVSSGQTFYLRQPKLFTRVNRKIIYQASDQLQCTALSHFTYTSIQSQFKLKEYQADSNSISNWQTQIISAVHVVGKNQLLIMLTDGTVVEAEYQRKSRGIIQEKRRYGMKGRAEDWYEIQLFTESQIVYALHFGTLRRMIFDGDQWSWGQSMIQDEIRKVKTYQKGLFVLTHKKLLVIENGLKVKQFKVDNQTLADFDMNNNKLYLLTNTKIIVLQPTTFFKSSEMMLQNSQYAFKIRSHNQNILVVFQRYGQTIIRQYISINDNLLSKGQIHRQFQDISDILLVGKYAIVNQHFQFSVMEVFTGSNGVIPSSQKILTYKYGSIVDLRLLQNDGGFGLMLVLPNYVQFISIKNRIEDLDIFEGVLACKIAKKGSYSMQIFYQGICGEPVGGCESTVTYNIEVISNKKTEIFRWMQIIMLLVGLTIVLIGILLYLNRAKQIKDQILLKQKQIQKDQTKIKSKELMLSEPDKEEVTYDQIKYEVQ